METEFVFDPNKTDRENFEIEAVMINPRAQLHFHTWSEEEDLYTHPQLCFMWQMAKMRYDVQRCMGLLEKRIADNAVKNG